MRLFERVLRRTARWIESIDQERDRLAQSVDGTRIVSEIHRAFVTARLGVLEHDRLDALALLAELETLQYRPELMFPARPRMLRVTLRERERKRA